MRAIPFILIAFFVIHPSAAAAEVAVTPLARFAPTRQALHEWCGAGRFDACTAFIGFGLEATCDKSRLTANARVTALMLLRDVGKAAHEREHIRHVEESLAQWLAELESRRYESAEQCQAAAFQAQGSVSERMKGFARESAERMHER